MAAGRVQTVLGNIAPEELGTTYTHEHLCLDYSPVKYPPKGQHANKDKLPLSLENLGWIRRNPYSHDDNLTLEDSTQALLEELRLFKKNGGSTIVEVTTHGIARNLPCLQHLSRETGVNIVAGAGYYLHLSHPADMSSRTVEQLCATIVSEVETGADGTDIKCGVIGELGCSFPLYPNEKKVLQAGALAQKQLGCPLIIHPGRQPEAAFEIIRILQEAGADIGKTVMSHLDRTVQEFDTLAEFAQLGSYCEYDMFGIEESHYQHDDYIDMPSDAQRIQRVKYLIDQGFEDRIVIGHDIHTKHRLTKYGGHGYSHILTNIAPKMLLRGISQEQVDKILIENPQRWLTFA